MRGLISSLDRLLADTRLIIAHTPDYDDREHLSAEAKRVNHLRDILLGLRDDILNILSGLRSIHTDYDW